MSSAPTEKDAPQLCPWGQTAPERPSGQESVPMSLQMGHVQKEFGRESVGYTLFRMASTGVPRYWAMLVSSRFDLFKLKIIPRSQQRQRRSSQHSCRQGTNSPVSPLQDHNKYSGEDLR